MINIRAARMARVRRAQGRDAKTASVPAPIGGWNARDPLAQMKETDAPILENWWPLPYDVMVRNGYSNYTTGLPSYVDSLMVYNGAATSTMFGASGTAFYNVGAGGAVGAAVVTGLTNARWEYTNITTTGGNFLMAVNGFDKLRGWDGSAWWTDGDGTHDITGIDTATIAQINLFKNRVWLIAKSTLKAWYLPTSSIAGAAQALDLSSIAQEGGYLMAMGTWTLDAGYGVDDMAVFLTSQGEVIVYRGTDPSSASTWSLVGVWNSGSPFSRRCFMKFGGDLLLLTYDGILPLAQALQSSRLDPRINITDKIYTAISSATSDYGTTFGWDMEYYAKANMLIVNVPVAVDSQQQFCMNTITKAWCNFTGLAANCWAIFNDEPYFGGNTVVGKFWTALADNAGNITADAKQAFNYFGARGQQKHFTMLRPTLRTSGSPTALIGLNLDFTDFYPTSTVPFTASAYGTWDSATWDAAASIWGGGGLDVNASWQGANGVGYCAAVRLRVAQQGLETHWASTDWVMERGGIL